MEKLTHRDQKTFGVTSLLIICPGQCNKITAKCLVFGFKAERNRVGLVVLISRHALASGSCIVTVG
jgi:hypothetical protein